MHTSLPVMVTCILFVTAAGQTPTLAADSSGAPDLQVEIRRSKPDYVVYTPKSTDGSTFDNGNEHFLVFDGPDGSLMAVWTQSTAEGAGDHRIMFSSSKDEGVSWTQPKRLAGSPRKGEGRQASWGFPMVSRSGRIYVVYNQYQDISDYHHQVTGTMDCIYSDDNGQTWSSPGTVPMKRSPYDHPDPKYPSNWIVWQKPERDLKGRYYVGFTRWVSPKVRTPPHEKSWTTAEAVVEFMRFENIDDNPEPNAIRLRWFACGESALRVGHRTNPRLSVAQEPSIVRLPDDRLFCTMRTMTGYIWYSLSKDDGETWCPPRPLRRHDHGELILDTLLYEKYSQARRLVLGVDPNHLVSFRMSEAGNPNYRWDGRITYDFPYLAAAVNFLAPEAVFRVDGMT